MDSPIAIKCRSLSSFLKEMQRKTTGERPISSSSSSSASSSSQKQQPTATERKKQNKQSAREREIPDEISRRIGEGGAGSVILSERSEGVVTSRRGRDGELHPLDGVAADDGDLGSDHPHGLRTDD